jgi:hypothetical protein
MSVSVVNNSSSPCRINDGEPRRPHASASHSHEVPSQATDVSPQYLFQPRCPRINYREAPVILFIFLEDSLPRLIRRKDIQHIYWGPILEVFFENGYSSCGARRTWFCFMHTDYHVIVFGSWMTRCILGTNIETGVQVGDIHDPHLMLISTTR